MRLGRRATGSRPSSATRTTSSTSSRRCARRGVRTIGRFVWEHFTAEHVAGAREAFDVVYSLTRAEQARYAEMGLETPYVTWGCHPELVAVGDEPPSSQPRRTGHASSSPAASSATASRSSRCSRRSTATDDPRLRLVVKAQVERKQRPRRGRGRRARPADRAAARRPADRRAPARGRELRRLPRARRAGRGSGCRCTRRSPSGMPAITNDAPPMNEAIHDGVNGAARRLDAERDGDAPGSPRSTPTSASCGARSSGSPTTRCAPSSPRARVRVRDSERPWTTPWRESASCWKPPRTGSLEGFMGFTDQIDRYRKRCADRARRPAPARAHARSRRRRRSCAA